MSAIVGVDLSLDSTGLAVYAGGQVETHRIQSKPRPTGPVKQTKRGNTRTQTYLDKLTRFMLITHKVTQRIPPGAHVYLEGPSYASAGSSSHDIAGNWWLLYQALDEVGHKITVVPPSVVKKYATGSGNAAKDAVIAAMVRRHLDLTITGNDIADAVALLAIGCRLAGTPLETSMPALNLRALDTLKASNA